MRSTLPSALLALSLLLTACVTGPTLDRRLLLTEVGSNEIELYLDEDPGQALVLGDTHKLAVRVDDGTGTGTFTITVLDLAAADMRMQGGSFLVVWEENGYQGPPVAAPFVDGQSQVPGIKVAAGFLTGLRDHPAEVRLAGRHQRISRLIILLPETTIDVIDDVVRFGAPQDQRPVSGGTFQDDGTLANPGGSSSVQRRFMNGAPVEYDAEGDWIRSGTTSWGAATP